MINFSARRAAELRRNGSPEALTGLIRRRATQLASTARPLRRAKKALRNKDPVGR
jgi:hypothetical protein